jgi:MYXO-CTERM domain-containing protein
MNLGMIRKLGATLAALAIVACSSAQEDVGQSNDAVDYICKENASATLDGIPAYAYCGNFNVWSNNGVDTKSASGGTGWVQTEGGYGYQCVEYAVRYEHFKFGVGTGWGISYAYQMCNTHPSSMSKVSTPMHGDLMIFAPGSCGSDKTAGHVAVVDTVGSTSVKTVQENTAGSYTYNKSCASCWLHAANNTGDPCATAPSNGLYCGQSKQWGGGTKDVLYTCKNGVTTSKTTCAYGCIVEPTNTNDQCAAAPDAGSDASTDAAPPGDAAPTPIDAAPPPQTDAAPPPPQNDGGASSSNVNETGGCTTSGAGTPGSHMVGASGLLLAALALARRRR